MSPKLLDCFSGAGGCAKGYQEAGFYVVGVDINPQPRYIGDNFVQADALEALRILVDGGYITNNQGRRWYLDDFDTIHASPPCQVYSVTAALSNGTHPDLVEPTRDALLATGKPYVIENVPGAPLLNPIMLCGTMFGLRVIRHRLFETSPVIWWPPASCNHWSRIGENGFVCMAGDGSGNSNKYPAHSRRVATWQAAAGIDWMIKKELSQAIPPAYTEWLGRQLMETLLVKTAS